MISQEAESIHLQDSLVPVENRTRPEQYHARTEHALPIESCRAHRELGCIQVSCNTIWPLSTPPLLPYDTKSYFSVTYVIFGYFWVNLPDFQHFWVDCSFLGQF